MTQEKPFNPKRVPRLTTQAVISANKTKWDWCHAADFDACADALREARDERDVLKRSQDEGNALYSKIAKIVDEFHPKKDHRDSEWDVLPGGVRLVIEHYKNQVASAKREGMKAALEAVIAVRTSKMKLTAKEAMNLAEVGIGRLIEEKRDPTEHDEGCEFPLDAEHTQCNCWGRAALSKH